MQALRDRAAEVREAACSVFGARKQESAVATLLPMLSDPNKVVRKSAAAALKKITGEKHGTDVDGWRRWWQAEGERRFGRGREVTLLDRAAWERACEDAGAALPWTARRANLLVDGVGLADTPGRRVRVGDGVNTSANQTVQIDIDDVNDTAPVITAGQTFNVNEHASNGVSVGTAARSPFDPVPVVWDADGNLYNIQDLMWDFNYYATDGVSINDNNEIVIYAINFQTGRRQAVVVRLMFVD